MYQYRDRLIQLFTKYSGTSFHDLIRSWRPLVNRNLRKPKLSCCVFSFGFSPSVRLSFADVSEPSVRSIFKGLMKKIHKIQNTGKL
jgi:uncharacterized protein (DUF2344 family)